MFQLGLEFERGSMDTLSTFFDSLLFAAACAVGWVAFPVFLIGGAVALLGYALIAELASEMVQARGGSDDEVAARKTADRLCGTP